MDKKQQKFILLPCSKLQCFAKDAFENVAQRPQACQLNYIRIPQTKMRALYYWDVASHGLLDDWAVDPLNKTTVSQVGT